MKIEVETKFEIGQAVYLKQDLAAWNGKEEDRYALGETIGISWIPKGSKPKPLIVANIYVERCYGGIQVHYGVRLFRLDGGNSVIQQFTEIELHDKLEQLPVK